MTDDLGTAVRHIYREVDGIESQPLRHDGERTFDGIPWINALQFEGFAIHTSKRHLHDGEGEDIPLTTAEYDLLVAFVENSGRALTRDVLFDITRSRELSPFDRSIDILVSRLRKKLEADPKKPEVIKTIRGIGYMFTPQVTRS